MIPDTFTRPVVRPRNPARVLHGRIVRPVTGLDHLLFGIASRVAPSAITAVRSTTLNAGSQRVATTGTVRQMTQHPTPCVQSLSPA
jgi:hypothetical protein